jgi:hypothetical protein
LFSPDFYFSEERILKDFTIFIEKIKLSQAQRSSPAQRLGKDEKIRPTLDLVFLENWFDFRPDFGVNEELRAGRCN